MLAARAVQEDRLRAAGIDLARTIHDLDGYLSDRTGAVRLTAPSRKPPYHARNQATAAAHAVAASARKRRSVGLLIRCRWMLKVL